MSRIVSFELGNGRGRVQFEVASPPDEAVPLVLAGDDSEAVGYDSHDQSDDDSQNVGFGGDDVIDRASQGLAEALRTAQEAAKDVLDGFVKALDPNELELSFGLKFSGKLGVVVASTDAEATFNLKAKWVRK